MFIVPGSVAGVGEGHVACSQFIELPQSGQTAADGLPSLDPNQRSNLNRGFPITTHPLLPGLKANLVSSDGQLHVLGSGGPHERGRVVLHETFDDVHLVQEGSRGVLSLRLSAAHVR